MTTSTLSRPSTARDYQLRAVDELREAIKRHKSAVYVLPTGGGKTVVAGLIAQRVTERGGQVMLVVHRRELVKQAVDTLTEFVPGLDMGVEAPGWPSMPWAPLQICMVQSMVRRDHVARMRPTIVIWDEAHHVRAATWERAMSWWPGVPYLGLTATPERLDGKGLGAHFGAMVEGPSIQWLVNNINPSTGISYLAPCRTLTVPSSLDLSGLNRNRSGEYGAAIGERITPGVIADAADAYTRYAAGQQAIFFGVNRDHSRRVVERLTAMGVKAAHVDGDDHPARRDRIMAEFRDCAIQVVGNCDLISEGFDAPGCSVIMMGSPTRSITRYLQMNRAQRPGPGKRALILDLAGISHELGLPDEPREWSLEDGEVSERRKKKAKPRECPACHTMYYGRKCPECAYQSPLAEVEETRTDLVEAQGRPDRSGKLPNRRSELWRELGMAKRSSDVRAAVEAIGRRRGYKAGWAQHILTAWNL